MDNRQDIRVDCEVLEKEHKEALPGSSFGKKMQARASLSRKDQENMIARSNRVPDGHRPRPLPPPRASPRGGRCVRVALLGVWPFECFSVYTASPAHELV